MGIYFEHRTGYHVLCSSIGVWKMAALKIDKTDLRILSAVQLHGQISKTKLAALVNLSPTPCLARLTRLKAAGLIQGYRGDIALEKLGAVTRVVVTVSLTHHRKIDFDRFEARIKGLDEIVDCIATGGGTDYVMTCVTSNLTAFQTLMDTLLSDELGIERYMTYIVTRQVKSAQPNLNKLLGDTLQS